MTRPAPALLKPRKTPQQTRSAATIGAIHEATIQVLLAEGAGRLTTTRVAERAGVSVGTMYQYYPHKQALLYAIVDRHLQTIMDAMMAAAERLTGSDLAVVAEGLATAWLDAKTADMVASRAIYAIASDFDLTEVMARGMKLMTNVIATLLAAAPDARFARRDAVAFMLAAMLGGSVRVVMESSPTDEDFACLRQELPRACHAYLVAANGVADR
ncbi:TetR/AcrR family transcriptional regulator [Xanthobacter sp. KR7-65]|uniref:TetR/AcrR family transcriptional regulator n=1 Tax=Xanthobacter sp. KR7-65 TaxID=3156612 RepID=UPI0032B38897